MGSDIHGFGGLAGGHEVDLEVVGIDWALEPQSSGSSTPSRGWSSRGGALGGGEGGSLSPEAASDVHGEGGEDGEGQCAGGGHASSPRASAEGDKESDREKGRSADSNHASLIGDLDDLSDVDSKEGGQEGAGRGETEEGEPARPTGSGEVGSRQDESAAEDRGAEVPAARAEETEDFSDVDLGGDDPAQERGEEDAQARPAAWGRDAGSTEEGQREAGRAEEQRELASSSAADITDPTEEGKAGETVGGAEEFSDVELSADGRTEAVRQEDDAEQMPSQPTDLAELVSKEEGEGEADLRQDAEQVSSGRADSAEVLSEEGGGEADRQEDAEQVPSRPIDSAEVVSKEEGECESDRRQDAEQALKVPESLANVEPKEDETAEELENENEAVLEKWQEGGLEGTSMGGAMDFSEIEVEEEGTKWGAAGAGLAPTMGGPADFSEMDSHGKGKGGTDSASMEGPADFSEMVAQAQDLQGTAGKGGQTFPMGGSTDFSDIDLQGDDKGGKRGSSSQPSAKLPADVIIDGGVHGHPASQNAGGAVDFSNLGTVAEDGDWLVPRGSLRAVVAASMIGNILEWYDFGVFAYFAPEIGTLFFPKTDAASGVLSAFAVFGGAFFIRPLGGVLFGYVGDKYGRKVALYVSVMMMASSTFVMGCLPTYGDAGLIATFLLVMCRMMQGLSVGGELVGSMIFAVESSPPNRKCFIGSLCLVGAILGLVLGSFTGLVIHAAMSPEDVGRYGWRIPFLLGVLIGGFALWIRSGLHESLEFEQSVHARRAAELELQEARGEVDLHEEGGHVSNETKSLMVIPDKIPLLLSVKNHPLEVLSMLIVSGCFGIGIWVLTAFPPSLYQDLMKPPLGEPRDGRRAEGGAMFDRGHLDIWHMHTALCLVPCFSQALFGYLGDYVGNVRMMLIGTFSVAVLAIPCLYGMGVGTYTSAAFGQGILLFAVGIIGGNLPTWMVTAFPIEVRFTAIAVGYNAGQALFGGTAGIFATLIYRDTQQTALIGLYHSIICVLAFLSIVLLERYKRSKDDPLRGGPQEI